MTDQPMTDVRRATSDDRRDLDVATVICAERTVSRGPGARRSARAGRSVQRPTSHAQRLLLLPLFLAGCGSSAGSEEVSPPIQELAPTGSLRVAVAIAPAPSTFFSARDAVTGELRGVAVDLGARLAGELGVPVEYVEYPNSGELTAAASAGEWDVTFMPVDEERARQVMFGPAYNLFESTYLVPPGSQTTTVESVDRAGAKVAIIENTTTGRAAAAQLKAATLVPFRSVDEVIPALRRGEVDAVAMSRASLRNVAAALPGSRVLDEYFHATANAVAVPPGRPAAHAYVGRFVEAAKASGAVREAFDRAGLADAVVAPPEPAP